MKYFITTIAAFLLTIVAFGQAFEGEIKWSMKVDITDPKAKAQMEEAKKKMNDPASQAKMKEMQAKMNDPQMKAMMEQNPQMKAQMENMMKMMQGGDPYAMMPTGMTVRIKGANTLTRMEGGMMDKNDILYIASEDKTYNINHQAKTISSMPKHEGGHHDRPQPKITKTNETAKIFNYNCTKYIIESQGPDGKSQTTFYWATNDIKDVDLKALMKQRPMSREDQSFIYDSIDGIPVKIEVKMPQGTMTMEMTGFKKGGVSDADFKLPAGYQKS